MNWGTNILLYLCLTFRAECLVAFLESVVNELEQEKGIGMTGKGQMFLFGRMMELPSREILAVVPAEMERLYYGDKVVWMYEVIVDPSF